MITYEIDDERDTKNWKTFCGGDESLESICFEAQ